MTTVTCYDESPNIYTVPVGQFNIHTSVDESKYEEIHHNALIVLGGYISKKEPRKIFKKTVCLYIVPSAPNLFYQQGNNN